MTNKLTPKQVRFADAYLDTGNATEAASRAYKPENRNTAHAIGSENLRKPTIRSYLDTKARDAVAVIYALSQGAKSEAVRLNASKDILDRAGYFVNKANIADEVKKDMPIPILVEFMRENQQENKAS